MKRLGNLFFLVGLMPIISFASTKPLDEALSLLNKQTAVCMEYKARRVNTSDSWLRSLPKNQLKVALLEINAISMENCTLRARERYSYQLVLDSAISGDRTEMERWIKLNAHLKSESYKDIMKDIPQDQILRLSNLPEFKLPFDTLKTFEKVSSD